MPYHAWASYQLALGASASTELADWATLFAGAYAQAQVTYVGSVAFEWVKFGPLAPNHVPPAALGLGGALAVLPALFAARCRIMAH